MEQLYANLREAIGSNLLSVNGTLYEEPLKLFKDDIKDMVKTATIMSYVGAGAHRLSEITGRCGEMATNLSRPLAKGHIIIPKLFLKHAPIGTMENVLLPEDIMNLQ